MEILEILERSAGELYKEDLDFFETELATGDYDDTYIAVCKEKIAQIRNWKTSGDEKPEVKPQPKKQPSGLYVGIGELAPKKNNPTAATMKPEDILFADIKHIRTQDGYKTAFKKYVAEKPEIDAAFVDRYYSFFESWELNAILSVKQMGEEFLEKYFGALDRDKIARYQLFSEHFFMKHYSQMNAELVLNHGKNPWREKGNRTKQLDVFLRLKGVGF